MSEHRWSKFWWQDYDRDPALRMCSLAAQGLWMRLLCVMGQAEDQGHLQVNGRVPTARQIGILTGAGERDAQKLMQELQDNGVFSLTPEGVPFSRRMVRDKARSEAGRVNGKEGGNPKLRKVDKADETPPDNTGGNDRGITPPPTPQEDRSRNRSR